MNKSLAVLFLIAFIIPSVAFASWWNPFTWKIFSSKTSTEVQTIVNPKTPTEKKDVPSIGLDETISCNGQVWNKCPVGQKFVCPTGQGDAYCEVPKAPKAKNVPNNIPSVSVQPTTPVYIAPPVVQIDMSRETALKTKAIDALSQQIKAVESFDNFLVESIKYINYVRRDNLGYRDELSKSTVVYADAMLGEFQKKNVENQEFLTYLQSEKSSLQSQPLSYFSSYQAPQGSSDFLNALPKMVSSFVDSYNTFIDSIKTSDNLRSQISNRTHCYVQGYGNSASIDCY